MLAFIFGFLCFCNLKSSTKAVETLSEKDMFRWTSEFFNLQYSHSVPPLPFSMLQPCASVRLAYFNIEKGDRGLAIDKKDFFWNYRKDADRKRLSCSNVSTLLSLIVAKLSSCIAKGTTTINKIYIFIF